MPRALLALLRSFGTPKVRALSSFNFSRRRDGEVSALSPSSRRPEGEVVARRPSIRRNPISVLSSLWVSSFRNPSSPTQLSPFLSSFELWLLAYQKAFAEDTGTYVPLVEIPDVTLSSLFSLCNAVIAGSFQWNERLRPILRGPHEVADVTTLSNNRIWELLSSRGPSPFQDRVVQEVLMLVLEPVLEARFSSKSFAFRPNRSALSALRTVRRQFAPYLWYIKGDLSRLVANTPHHSLVVNALSRNVTDQRVVELVRSALVTPVPTGVPRSEVEAMKLKKRKYRKKRVKLEEGMPKPDPYWLQVFFKFSPVEAQLRPDWGHCGILAPLLMNLLLNDLDKWMEGKIEEFYRPSESDVLCGNDGEIGSSWPEYLPKCGLEKTRKMDYIRYGAHFMIGIRGPKADATELRESLIEFLEQQYNTKMENKSFPIVHITEGIMFLDHLLSRRVVCPPVRYTATGGEIIKQKGLGTMLSMTASVRQCIKLFRNIGLLKGNDKDPDPQPCFRMFHASQSHTNETMNKLLLTISEWYRYADNRKKVITFCSYIIRGSLAKMYCIKFKLRTSAKVYKVASRDLGRPIKDRLGLSPEYRNMIRMGLLDQVEALYFTRLAMAPNTDHTRFPSNWRPKHEKALLEHIKLSESQTLQELRSYVDDGLMIPQDYMSMLLWNCKKTATLLPSVASDDSNANLIAEKLLPDKFKEEANNEHCEDDSDFSNAAEM